MKASILSSILIVPTLAAAQAWCPPGAVWNYGSGDSGDQCLPAQSRFIYSGDTVVDGYLGQRIDRFTQLIWQGTVNESSAFAGVTRTNGDVVWEWNGTTWDTLYWFSAIPGDNWQPFWPYQQDCPDHAWFVLDTFTTVMDGVNLRSMNAEIRENGEPTGVWSTFTERLGRGAGIVFPGIAPCGGVFECAWGLICYQDDEIGTSDPCELTLGVPSWSADPVATARPNPSDGYTRLTWPGREGFSVRAFDLNGRQAGEWGSLRPDTPLDLSHLTPGLYELVLTTPDGKSARIRLLNQ